jgi:hypothetical protein
MVLGWLRRRVAEDVRVRLGEDRILLMDDRANSFGVGSAGVFQLRGNGCLAATADEVMFLMWIPRGSCGYLATGYRSSSGRPRTWARPSPSRCCGSTTVDETGRPDSVAWFVRDLPAWEATLG